MVCLFSDLIRKRVVKNTDDVGNDRFKIGRIECVFKIRLIMTYPFMKNIMYDLLSLNN